MQAGRSGRGSQQHGGERGPVSACFPGELRHPEVPLEMQVEPGPRRKLGLPFSGSGVPSRRLQLGITRSEDIRRDAGTDKLELPGLG